MPKKKTTRRRKIPKQYSAEGSFYKAKPIGSNKWVLDFRAGADFSGTQVTESEGHPWPPPKGAKLEDVGGPFKTVKKYTEFIANSTVELRAQSLAIDFKYNGAVIPPLPSISGVLDYPPDPSSSDSTLNQVGAEFIDLCKPTNTIANVSTFLSELLHEKLPSLPGIRTWEKRTQAYLGIAEDFLNVVFGWLPLKADVESISEAVKEARDEMIQYERDAGKVVRRQWHAEKETTEEITTIQKNVVASICGGHLSEGRFVDNSRLGVLKRKRVTTRERWFKGAFTYHLPSSSSLDGLISAGSSADKVFGTTLTPEVLWELTPWSWAIDWFSNAQNVISNIQDFELYGLIMRWGYLMEHSITKDTYYLEDGSGLIGVPFTTVPAITLVTESKKRVQANPFGFGVSWDGLSTIQAAILAALGITRAV